MWDFYTLLHSKTNRRLCGISTLCYTAKRTDGCVRFPHSTSVLHSNKLQAVVCTDFPSYTLPHGKLDRRLFGNSTLCYTANLTGVCVGFLHSPTRKLDRLVVWDFYTPLHNKKWQAVVCTFQTTLCLTAKHDRRLRGISTLCHTANLTGGCVGYLRYTLPHCKT